MFARVREGRIENDYSMGRDFQSGNDGKVLEIYHGDGDTTLWMYLMPMNYIVKMIR